MSQSLLESSEAPGSARANQIRASMHQIQQRQWRLWSSAVLVMLLLALGIASFAFPRLFAQAEAFSSFYLGQAAHGLVGLVLLFNVYTIYQQLQIHRIQKQVSDQVDALGKIEVRTEEVYKLAVLDPLTGLFNRRSGEQRLADEISRAQRYRRPLTVLMLDINGLKHVNDSFGHLAGDQLIRHFGERLQRAIRGSDVAVRFGGDEFLALLPECKLGEVHHVLGRLSAMKMDFSGQVVPLTFSAGWTDYIPGELREDLLKRADAALYINKRAGKEKDDLNAAVTLANDL
jgi:diguanylate cyclase (GGDEF)-like protein